MGTGCPPTHPLLCPPQPCEVLPLRGVQAGGLKRPHGAGAPPGPPARGHGPPAHQTLGGGQEAEGGPGAGAQVGVGRVGGFGGGLVLPMGWGEPHGAACALGGSSPSSTAPCPQGLGARGEPPGVWPPRGVPPWAWPFGVWPLWGHGLWGMAPWGMALLLDVCQLKDLLRLWWSLCWGWGGGGALGVAPPGEGPGSTPCELPRPVLGSFNLSHPFVGSTHFSANHAPDQLSPQSCSFIGQCKFGQGACSQSGASAGGWQG